MSLAKISQYVKSSEVMPHPSIYFDSKGRQTPVVEQEDTSYFKPVSDGVTCNYYRDTLTIEWTVRPTLKCKTALIAWLKTEPKFKYRILPPAQVDAASFNQFNAMMAHLVRTMQVKNDQRSVSL